MTNEEKPQDFFDVLQNSIDTVIPPLLKAILTASGVNDQLTLASVVENLGTITSFIDSSDGVAEVRNVLGDNISEVEEKYLSKPSTYLKIPGNQIRIKGIQEYCVNQNQKKRDRDSREKQKTPKATTQRDRSRSPGQQKKKKEADENTQRELMESKLLSTIKTQVQKLNIISSQKVALEKPSVKIFTAGAKMQASITCLACNSQTKDQVTTAYAKGKSWLVTNYKRHIERAHLQITPTKSDGSLDNYFQKKQTEETTETITVEVDPINIQLSDDEEENLRNSREQNFCRKE